MFGGSHARGSKIRPVLGRQGDVDIYVVLKGDERNYGGLLQPPPAKLLADVKKTLDRYLKTPKVRADSPAVRITYDDMIVDVGRGGDQLRREGAGEPLPQARPRLGPARPPRASPRHLHPQTGDPLPGRRARRARRLPADQAAAAPQRQLDARLHPPDPARLPEADP